MKPSLPIQITRFLSVMLITTCLLQVNILAGEKLVNQQGTIQKIGSVGFVLVPDGKPTRYAPSKLAAEFQQDRLRVVFSGEVGKIPPNVRLIGTPLKLTAIAKADARPTPGVREISGLNPAGSGNPRGNANKPTIVKDKAGVAKSLSDKASQQKVLKEVNFDKEILLVFRWAGSGQDRIAATSKKTDDGIQVVFGYTRGLTRDLRRHFKVFAVAKNAKWKVETKRFVRPGRPGPTRRPGSTSLTPESPGGLTRTRIRVR